MRILRPSANPDEYTRRVSLALPGLTIRAYLLRGYRGRGSDRQSNRTNGQALRVSFRTSHPFVRRRLSLAPTTPLRQGGVTPGGVTPGHHLARLVRKEMP